MFSVVLKGFPTREEAEEFITWYGEHGEQDIGIWFEDHNEANGGRSPMVKSYVKDDTEIGEMVEATIKMM